MEGHRKVARDDRSLSKRDFVRKFYCVARRHYDQLRVAAPTVDADPFTVDAIEILAFETWRAFLTGGRRDDRNAIAWFELRDAIVEIDDFASRIGAEHMRQLNLHRILAGADDANERGEHRDRVDFYQNLAHCRLGCGHAFKTQYFRTTVFFEYDGVQGVVLD